MNLGLAGASVVVTGGGANIGRAIVHAFAREGARVLVADIDGDQAEAAAGEAVSAGAEQAQGLAVDLTAPGAGDVVVGGAVEAFGRLDVLVNNAGWSRPGWFGEQRDRALWQRTIETNLFSAIDCSQAALATMREQGGGTLVFVSSDAAFGALRQGIYGAAKAGVISLARTIARENGRYGVRANTVVPGMVLPAAGAPVGPHSLWADGIESIFTKAQAESVLATQPLRRRTEAQDIANAVVWLASDTAARQVTGQTLGVGGGSTMP
jgi:2-hydroxycyclohexanecarboxyl-CoA dehydrogenase